MRRALPNSQPAETWSRGARGFTLIELMISIALVLMLMLGINQVFKVTGEAVGAGQAISVAQRDARAAQAVFGEDFAAAVREEAPFMLLLSRTQPAFRNRADELGDRDFVPVPNPTANNVQGSWTNILTVDIDRNGVEGEASVPGEIIHPTTINARNHRTDIFSFFGRGLFRRQTGGDEPSGGESPFVADMTTSEAWIWYGHLQLPDNNGDFDENTDPGMGNSTVNPNNFHAANWMLGRVAIGLKDKNADTSTGNIEDRAGRDQYFIDRSWTTTEPVNQANPNLSPLAHGSDWNGPPGPNAPKIQSSRFDLAATTISQFSARLRAAIIAGENAYGPNGFDWFTRFFLSHGRRFQANPFLSRPITAAGYAQQFPIFLPNCSQFIVEYAGDFVNQVNDPADPLYGEVLNAYFDPFTGQALPTDGVIDYIVDKRHPVTGQPTTNRAYWRTRIRWYGMPRDVTGPDSDGVIRIRGDAPSNNDLLDVVPLRDVIRTSQNVDYSGLGENGAPFEKFEWNGPAPLPAANSRLRLRLNYAAPGNAGMQSTERYICAWGPDDPKPTLIRIIYTLDDPAGRLGEPQTFEYVFRVGG